MTAFQPAIFSTEHKQVGETLETGRQSVAMVQVQGVQWRSWLPQSVEDCEAINAVGRAIMDQMCSPAPFDVEIA